MTEMTLGPYRFAVDTASLGRIERSAAWRWPAQERIDREPALQYLGPGVETVTLSGLVFPAWRGGTGQVAAMRDAAATGEPLLLTDGAGRVWGRWAIRGVREVRTELEADGEPRRVEYELDLAYYGRASASASPSTPATIAPLSGGVGLQGSEARAAFQQIELLPAPVRSDLRQRVSLVDRARERARQGLSLHDALGQVAGDLAGDLQSKVAAAGLESVPRRLWGPSELLKLLPDVPDAGGTTAGAIARDLLS